MVAIYTCQIEPPATALTFETSEAKQPLEGLAVLSNQYREAVTKVEIAVDLNSISVLRSACVDLTIMERRTSELRANLEKIAGL